MRIIENCSITHSDTEVVKNYDVAVGSEIYHTGIDLKCSEIYSICPGVVIQECLFESKPSVVIQYSGNISLRFSHLKEAYVHEGQLVNFNTPIGEADSYVHFEYLTSQELNSNFSYKIPPNITLWKHDPNIVLDKLITFNQSVSDSSNIELFGETLAELSNNRG